MLNVVKYSETIGRFTNNPDPDCLKNETDRFVRICLCLSELPCSFDLKSSQSLV